MYLVNALNVIDEVKKAVIGKDSCVEMVMMAMLARGHILIQDIPGHLGSCNTPPAEYPAVPVKSAVYPHLCPERDEHGRHDQ